MSNYFQTFPNVDYNFGNNETAVLFNNISTYVDILDQVVLDGSFYEKYFILDNDRPDIVSQNLYGTPDYHWTFFYLNHHVRESGWPLNTQDLLSKAIESYPNQTLTSESLIADKFPVGSEIIGNGSGARGTILRKRLDLGQIIVNSDMTFNNIEQVSSVENNANGFPDTANIINATEQYNSVDHYENSDGEYVDIDPYDQVTTGLTPITYLNKLELKNDQLKQINVLTPAVANQVINQFFRAIRQN